MRNQALYRQWQILQIINSRGNRGVSKEELADRFSVSKRTIARDITNLSSCYFPIYDEIKPESGGQVFYFLQERYRFPEITFSYPEMLAMYLLYSIYTPINPFLYESFKSIIDKISDNVNPETLKFMKDLQNYFLPDLYPYIKEKDTDKIMLISEAILNKMKISFDYESMQKKKKFCITPLGIKFYHNNFYLAAYYQKRDCVLTFAINRMDKLEICQEKADDVKFNIDEYFHQGFGLYHGETFWVKLQFKKEVSRLITERNWHSQQKITEKKDGSVILEMPASNLQEMVWFVLNYGSNVKVLEPDELKNELVDELIRIHKLY